MLHTEKNKSKTQNVCCIIIIILYCTIKKGFILPLNIPLIKKKCQNLICPGPPPPPCLFFLHSARKHIKLAWILRTYGTYALTKSSLLWCSCTRPSMNSDKTLSPIGKNKVERNSCEKNHYSHYYYFFLFIYYYSFKIFSHFWLAKIPSIIFIITSYCWPNLKNFAICVLIPKAEKLKRIFLPKKCKCTEFCLETKM